MDEFSCFNNHCVLNSSSMKAISTKTLWRLYLYTISLVFFFFFATIWSPWNYFKNSRTYALSVSPQGTYKENGHYDIALKKELVQAEVSIWIHIWVYSNILFYLLFFLYIEDLNGFLWSWLLGSECVYSLHSYMFGRNFPGS